MTLQEIEKAKLEYLQANKQRPYKTELITIIILFVAGITCLLIGLLS